MTDLMGLVSTFPEQGPYRVDQVRHDQFGLILLFAVQVCLALMIQWAAKGRRHVVWRLAVGAFLLSVGTFFTLSSWGLADVTRLSYFLVQMPDYYGLREPLWTLLAPLVRFLPYRFSFVHGVVAGCYAAGAIWLSVRSSSLGWAGWWALMIVYSPLLRNFLQTGVTRQALATVLLMPLMLGLAGGIRLSGLRTMCLLLFAAIVHSSFFMSLFLAASPALVAFQSLMRLPGICWSWVRACSRWLLLAVAAIGFGLAFWLVANAGSMREKMADYLWQQSYYPHFILRPEVDEVLLAVVVSVLLSCGIRGIGWREFFRARLARTMILFMACLMLVKLSIGFVWFPQITSRVQDAVGFYFLVVFLSWLASISMQRLAVVPLTATMSYWILNRLAFAGLLPCGFNDEFLCVPDRFPWDVVYWN